MYPRALMITSTIGFKYSGKIPAEVEHDKLPLLLRVLCASLSAVFPQRSPHFPHYHALQTLWFVLTNFYNALSHLRSRGIKLPRLQPNTGLLCHCDAKPTCVILLGFTSERGGNVRSCQAKYKSRHSACRAGIIFLEWKRKGPFAALKASVR